MKTVSLYKPIDNAPLVVFRIFFGFLLFAETLGAIFTGWVRKVMIEPEFTFSHIGFEWLQPIPGNGMYYYFLVMSIFGLMVMFGYKYRWSLGAFTILWTGAYLMQKETYNNHYYLLILVCIIMLFLPANRYASVDARLNPGIKSLSMPQWCSWVMIFQITIVYLFAVVSKLYPDWLDGTYIGVLFKRIDHPLFNDHLFHLFISWSGLLFDLLIVPMLLWKRTRTIAFLLALCFHIFNAAVLEIGIFPFFALSFILFFYPPEKVRWFFFRKKPALDDFPSKRVDRPILLYFFLPFFIIQVLLPLRHNLIEGDVLWTEEGHRLSWRMMLRKRTGHAQFRVVDKSTGGMSYYDFTKVLTNKQQGFVSSKPDGIWQMAQRIKQEYNSAGKDVAIYVNCLVSINDRAMKTFIDPNADLASEPWNYFGHSKWILLHDDIGQADQKIKN
ncbi:MAG TPA: HTTM domain-containing protein [Flavobacterium sp.]|jgi:hypothetical protein